MIEEILSLIRDFYKNLHYVYKMRPSYHNFKFRSTTIMLNNKGKVDNNEN